MSVIVKGMEMPESCYRCPMANDDFYLCGATEKYLENDSEERRPEWCPLIVIPTPHGRMIDADKLKGRLVLHGNSSEQVQLYANICEWIDLQETVIEAEGREE